jgi:hypothetical protein
VVVNTDGWTVPPSLILVGLLCLMITLTSCNRLLKLSILGSEEVVFLLETLGYSLEGDVTLDLALLIELDAGLKLSKLRLLAFSEGALRGSSGYTQLAYRASKVPTELEYLFWTRRPLASDT